MTNEGVIFRPKYGVFSVSVNSAVLTFYNSIYGIGQLRIRNRAAPYTERATNTAPYTAILVLKTEFSVSVNGAVLTF